MKNENDLQRKSQKVRKVCLPVFLASHQRIAKAPSKGFVNVVGGIRSKPRVGEGKKRIPELPDTFSVDGKYLRSDIPRGKTTARRNNRVPWGYQKHFMVSVRAAYVGSRWSMRAISVSLSLSTPCLFFSC